MTRKLLVVCSQTRWCCLCCTDSFSCSREDKTDSRVPVCFRNGPRMVISVHAGGRRRLAQKICMTHHATGPSILTDCACTLGYRLPACMGWCRLLSLKTTCKIEWSVVDWTPTTHLLRLHGVLVLLPPANQRLPYTCMDCIQPKKNRNYDQLSQVKTRSKHSVISSPVAKDRFRDCQLDDFKSKKVIAYGSSSKVRLVVEKRTGVYLILKEIYKKKLEDTLMEPWTEKEHVFMSKVRSPWLVEMYQVYETPARLSLLMEYLPGPNLLELVRSGKDLDDQDIRILASEMLMCVFAVHRRGYMHRDIKLSNFILDVRGHVKLCDFASCIRYIKAEICEQLFPEDAGLSVKPPEYVQQAHRTLIQQLEYRPCVPHGTSWYCAPEVIWLTTRQAVRDMEVRRLKGYSYTCDYWSYGVCLYYLMFKKLPFLPADKIRVRFRKLPSMIIHWRQTLKFQSGKLNVPASGVDIIQRLLRYESSRLGAGGIQEITTHCFFRHIDWNTVGLINHIPRKKTSCVSPTTTFRSKTGIFSCFKRPSSVKTASSTGMLLTPDYPTRLFSFRFPSGLAGAGRAAFRPECGPPDNASKISLATSSVASSRLSCALSSHSDDTDLTGFTFPLPKDVRVPVKSSLKKSRQRHEVELTTAASETAKGTREFALFHGDVDGDAERLRPGVHAVRSVSFDISTNPQAEAKRQASPGLIRNLFSRIRTASGLFGTDRAETRTESSLQDTSSASTVPGPLQVGTGPTSPSSVHMIFEAAQEEDGLLSPRSGNKPYDVSLGLVKQHQAKSYQNSSGFVPTVSKEPQGTNDRQCTKSPSTASSPSRRTASNPNSRVSQPRSSPKVSKGFPPKSSLPLLSSPPSSSSILDASRTRTPRERPRSTDVDVGMDFLTTYGMRFNQPSLSSVANSGTENLMEALFHDGAGEVASETQMSNASGT